MVNKLSKFRLKTKEEGIEIEVKDIENSKENVREAYLVKSGGAKQPTLLVWGILWLSFGAKKVSWK